MTINDDKYAILNKLKKIVDIYESNLSNNEKIYRMCKICKNSKSFNKLFIDNSFTLNRDSFYRGNLDKIKEIYNYYVMYENNGLINTINYYIDHEDYFNCYNYAKFVIEKYINDSTSYRFLSFLLELGIDNNIFEYCVKIVEELDKDLYNKYLNKKLSNNDKYWEESYYNVSNIINGIKTGKLIDGTTFNKEKFWELVPFKEVKNFDYVIRNYVESEFKKDYLIFLFYFSKFNTTKCLNNIKDKESFKKILIP